MGLALKSVKTPALKDIREITGMFYWSERFEKQDIFALYLISVVCKTTDTLKWPNLWFSFQQDASLDALCS